jgi:hypothetical protein
VDEKFQLETKETIENYSQLAGKVTNAPRFLLVHIKEPVFAYICPTSCPIKQKMVYSSSKPSLVNQIQIEKRVEVDSIDELIADLTTETGAVKTESNFKRPIRPGAPRGGFKLH